MLGCAELVATFLEERSQRVAQSTVCGDSWYLQRFFAFCVDQLELTQLGQLRHEHLGQYYRWLQTQPGKTRERLSDTFMHRALHVPRLFLMWCGKHGHVLLDFSSFSLPSQARRLPKVPVVEQVRRLLEAPDLATAEGLRDRLILEFFYVLGLRRRECHRLDLGDIDQTGRAVWVLGKGQRARVLPISSGLWSLLEGYLRQGRAGLRPHPEEQALWIAPTSGRRLGYGTMGERLTRYAEMVGLSLHPHQLRHACATHLLESGANLRHIQVLLGHARLSSTQHYTRIRPLEVHQEFLRCHPRARFSEEQDDA